LPEEADHLARRCDRKERTMADLYNRLSKDDAAANDPIVPDWRNDMEGFGTLLSSNIS
jgi:hypothetical protein